VRRIIRSMKLAALLLLAYSTLAAAEDAASRARSVLSQGASDNDPATRREVAIALSLINSRDTSAGLLATLAKDKDYSVRETAILTIGEINDPKLATVVLPALDDDVPEVAFAAARTLAKLRRPEGKRALVSIVSKETKGESGFFKDKVRDVARRMRTPKSALLFTVQTGIGFVPIPGIGQGFSAMNSMLADADFSARATALLVLAIDRTPEVRTILTQSFVDEDWSVRAAAVQAAALRNEPVWQPRLESMLNDSNKKVRFRAAAVYLRLRR
jgi:HEAT repeat protein